MHLQPFVEVHLLTLTARDWITHQPSIVTANMGNSVIVKTNTAAMQHSVNPWAALSERFFRMSNVEGCRKGQPNFSSRFAQYIITYAEAPCLLYVSPADSDCHHASLYSNAGASGACVGPQVCEASGEAVTGCKASDRGISTARRY